MNNPEPLQQHNSPGRINATIGNGGLPKLAITTPWSTAEIYLHGAHVTHFQKNGEPPLLFMSIQSWFAAGKPIRGGVPICFPWFGARAGGSAHGLARIATWEVAETSAAPDGSVTIRLRLPAEVLSPEWSPLRTEFTIKVAEKFTMELSTVNMSPDQTLVVENCLHTYFHVGDISAVSITSLQGVPFLDNAAGGNGERKEEHDALLRITRETNRIYLDTVSAVEIHDEKFRRTIRVEKSGAKSTVVWNPWTTQKLPDDFNPAEYRQMVCVESGNVNSDKISLPPDGTLTTKVVLSSQRT